MTSSDTTERFRQCCAQHDKQSQPLWLIADGSLAHTCHSIFTELALVLSCVYTPPSIISLHQTPHSSSPLTIQSNVTENPTTAFRHRGRLRMSLQCFQQRNCNSGLSNQLPVCSYQHTSTSWLLLLIIHFLSSLTIDADIAQSSTSSLNNFSRLQMTSTTGLTTPQSTSNCLLLSLHRQDQTISIRNSSFISSLPLTVSGEDEACRKSSQQLLEVGMLFEKIDNGDECCLILSFRYQPHFSFGFGNINFVVLHSDTLTLLCPASRPRVNGMQHHPQVCDKLRLLSLRHSETLCHHLLHFAIWSPITRTSTWRATELHECSLGRAEAE